MLKELRKRNELDELYLYAAGEMIGSNVTMATELPFRVLVSNNEVLTTCSATSLNMFVM